MSISTLHPAIQAYLRQAGTGTGTESTLSGEKRLFEALLRAAQASAGGFDLPSSARGAFGGMELPVSTAAAFRPIREPEEPETGGIRFREGTYKPMQAASLEGVPKEAFSRNPAAVPAGSAGSLGSLSARFESGSLGIEAIGYDPGGGTSYGRYQIASRPGTLDRFLNFLENRAPDWVRRLRAAGPANTGGRDGDMPRVWRAIAAEDPSRFEAYQKEFIQESHYRPAARSIAAQTGIDIENRSESLKEVLWSTAVQHGSGRAANIFADTLASLKADGRPVTDEAVIEGVYRRRAESAEWHTPRIRASLLNRFEDEKATALRMLSDKPLTA